METDDIENPFPLVLVMKFKSRNYICEALAWRPAGASKETSEGLLDMFDGDVIHSAYSRTLFFYHIFFQAAEKNQCVFGTYHNSQFWHPTLRNL